MLSDKIELFKKLQTNLPFLLNENSMPDELNTFLINEIKNNQNDTEKAILISLYEINRIQLNEKSDTPFSPYVNTNLGITSVKPDFLKDEELDFYIEIFDIVKNKMLKARIADILWYLKYKKNIKYPKYMLEVYLSLDYSDSKNFWHIYPYLYRGLYIARQIKEDISKFEVNLYSIFDSHLYENTAYLLRLSEIFRDFNLCKEKSENISKKLELFGTNLELSKQYYLAEQYYNEASFWSSAERKVELQIKRVYSYIHNAEEKESIGIAERSHYESALKILRTIEKNEREKFISHSQEEELIRKMQKAGQHAINGMKETSVTIDVTDSIKSLEDNFKGKNKSDALKQLLFCANFVNVKDVEETSIVQIKSSPLLSLCTHVMYAKDGRVVHQSSGIDFNENLNKTNSSVWETMIWQYTFQITLTAQTVLLTALNLLNNDHHITYFDVKEIVKDSNIISETRQEIFIKGLLAGLSYDFITAVHLLVPQIENLVREQLQIRDVKTVTIDQNGLEIEVGLSTLVEKQEFTTIFGDDMAFEIRALLCESTGPNLRNNIAHGLLDYNQIQNTTGIYFWWFCFKLVYLMYLNNTNQHK